MYEHVLMKGKMGGRENK